MPKPDVSAADQARASDRVTSNEEFQRRMDLLEKKERAYTSQSQALNDANQRIRDLVRSENEAAYKSRTLSAKLAIAEKSLEDAIQQKKNLERSMSKNHQETERLRFELESVKQKLSALEERSQSRNQDTEQLKHKNRDLEAKLSRTTSKLDLFQGKMDTLRRTITDKDTEAVLASQKLELALREQQRLKKELEETRLAARDNRQNRTELEESVFQNSRKLAEAEETLERQRLSLERLSLERDEFKQEAERVKLDLEKVQRKRRDQEQRVEELLEQVEALEQYQAEEAEAFHQELAKREDEEKKLRLAYERLEQASTQDSKASATLETEKSELLAEKAELMAQIEATNAEVVLKQRQIAELTRWAERVRPAYETLKSKFSDLQQEYRTLHSAHGESLSKSQHQAGVIESLQRNESQNIEAIELLTAQLEELQQELESSTTTTRDKSALVATLESRVEDLSQALENAQEDAESSRANTERVEVELQDLTELLEEVSQERLELDERLAETESELSQSRQEYEALELQLQESNKLTTRLSHEVAQAQSQSSKAQSNLKELLRQRGQLLDAKKLLEDALADAQHKEQQLLGRLADSEAQRENTESALDELQLEFEGVNRNWIDRIKELEANLDGVNQLLDQEREQREELMAQSAQERTSFELQIEELQSAQRENEEARAELVRQVEEVHEALEIEQERGSALEQELEAASTGNLQLADELVQSQTEVERLGAELCELHQQMESVQAELERHKQVLRKRTDERNQVAQSFEAAAKQNKALREIVARSQKESLGLRDYIEKLQALSKERLDQARQAIEKRDAQLKSQLTAYRDAQNEAAQLKRRLERTQLSEAALKGALVDLRSQLLEKDEMVEELEWHLGLIYQTLEDGQVELETKETELAQLTNELEGAENEVLAAREQIVELESQLEATTQERKEIGDQAQEFEAELIRSRADLELQALELERVSFQLDRTTARLERVLNDLSEEQDRSVKLGSQLTDALEDRNKRVQRLRELQKEFSEWRQGDESETSAQQSAQIDELTQELVESQKRELELQRALGELREALVEQTQLMAKSEREFNSAERDAGESPGAAGKHSAPDSEAERELLDQLSSDVLTGVELGSQVLSAQMDLLQINDQRDSLNDMINQADTEEAIAELQAELRTLDETRQTSFELFEALDSEWHQFCDELSPPARALLTSLVEIVESEMNQTHAAEARVCTLQQQLEELESEQAGESTEQIKRLLAERTLLAEELEEELSVVSAQLADASDQLALQAAGRGTESELSWRETNALIDELREKTALVERYREEYKRTKTPGTESLEEELGNLNARYLQGRRRIVELLQQLEERDRMLADLARLGIVSPGNGQSPESPEDDADLSPLLTDDEFELPTLPLDGLGDDKVASAIVIEQLDEVPPPDFDFKEDTVEDLPAIPCLEEEDEAEERDGSESFEGSGPSDSQSATPDC